MNLLSVRQQVHGIIKPSAQNGNTKYYGGIKTGTVGNLVTNGSYTYQWFDPTSGEYSEQHEFTATKLGTYYIGDRPQATDMVLLIRVN